MERVWLAGFNSLGFTAVFLFLLAERLGWPTFREVMLHSATAAWIQAVGSIGAIAAAAWVVHRQHTLTEATRARERIEARVETINGALLVLLNQLNVLLVYRKQILDPEEANPIRHFALPATIALEYNHWLVDWQRLAFLVETNAHDTLMDLMIAHNAFHTTIKALNDRIQVHRLEFQPKMEASGLDFSKAVLVTDIEKAAGPRITHTLRAATDDVYEQVDIAISHLTRAGDFAPKALRKTYVGHKIAGFSDGARASKGGAATK